MGPMGIGVLYGKKALLEEMPPFHRRRNDRFRNTRRAVLRNCRINLRPER